MKLRMNFAGLNRYYKINYQLQHPPGHGGCCFRAECGKIEQDLLIEERNDGKVGTVYSHIG